MCCVRWTVHHNSRVPEWEEFTVFAPPLRALFQGNLTFNCIHDIVSSFSKLWTAACTLIFSNSSVTVDSRWIFGLIHHTEWQVAELSIYPMYLTNDKMEDDNQNNKLPWWPLHINRRINIRLRATGSGAMRCYAPRREPRFGCWRCSSLIVATTAVSRATGGVEELAVSKKSWILRWSPGTLGTSAGMTFTKYLQAPLSDNQAEKLMILMMFTQAFASCWKPSRPWHLRKSTNRRKMFLTLSPAAVGACLPTCPPTCHCSLAVDWWASREKPS